MLEKRPLVIDSWANPILLGGNQRLAVLVELGYQEIPEEWVKTAEGWTDAQKQEFMIKDNDHAGMWDWEKLGNWDLPQLAEWGLSVPAPKTVEQSVKAFTNDNCSYPLVAHHGQKNDAIVIVCATEKDVTFIQKVLGMGTETSSKKGTVGQTFVITAQNFIAKWKTATQDKDQKLK